MRADMEAPLYKALHVYERSDFYPLHMPGHKRQMRPFSDLYGIDITEIDGFDNLHHAEGLLLEAQRRAARLYHAEESFFLINGSTCGILAAVSAAVPRGGKLLMARNCHKAAYHAALLNGLSAVYLYPQAGDVGCIRKAEDQEPRDRRGKADVSETMGRDYKAGQGARIGREHVPGLTGGIFQAEIAGTENRNCREGVPELAGGICGAIDPEAVRRALAEDRSIRAVLITSPTYDGVTSDVRQIAGIAHEAGAVLIVDEAHGAHFGMHPYFPEHSLACGADLVINSLHKTLPSPTQTALLHVQGPRVDRDRLRNYLGIYQTSSPSYVLMAGMDACIGLLLERKDGLFGIFVQRLRALRSSLSGMRVLHLVDGQEKGLYCYAFDRSKVLVSTERTGRGGPWLAETLRQRYHLEVEMEAAQYVTAIMTIADTEEGFARLQNALLELDGELWEEKEQQEQAEAVTEAVASRAQNNSPKSTAESGQTRPEAVMSIAKAVDCPKEEVTLAGSCGCISGEFVYLYPPGIPMLVPGERISGEVLEELLTCRLRGQKLQGLRDYQGENILVVRES